MNVIEHFIVFLKKIALSYTEKTYEWEEVATKTINQRKTKQILYQKECITTEMNVSAYFKHNTDNKRLSN